MDAVSTTTLSSRFVPKASCLAAVLSVLPALWIFLAATPSGDVAPLAFGLSVSLAVTAVVLGLIGLFVGRPYTYSISGILLSGGVLVFWGFLLLMAIVSAMIALP